MTPGCRWTEKRGLTYIAKMSVQRRKERQPEEAHPSPSQFLPAEPRW